MDTAKALFKATFGVSDETAQLIENRVIDEIKTFLFNENLNLGEAYVSNEVTAVLISLCEDQDALVRARLAENPDVLTWDKEWIREFVQNCSMVFALTDTDVAWLGATQHTEDEWAAGLAAMYAANSGQTAECEEQNAPFYAWCREQWQGAHVDVANQEAEEAEEANQEIDGDALEAFLAEAGYVDQEDDYDDERRRAEHGYNWRFSEPCGCGCEEMEGGELARDFVRRMNRE